MRVLNILVRCARAEGNEARSPLAPNTFGGSTGTLDIYTIAADGLTLSLQTTSTSQLTNPDGAASGTAGTTTFIFSGQLATPAGTEAHTLNTSGDLGTVPGSPQTDPASNYGANVLFTDGLVTQTQQFSNSVGAYGRSGSSYAFKSHAALDSTAVGPQAQTSISHFLLVENYGSRTISDCQLASSGVSGCVLAATLTSNGSSSAADGIGVIPA